MAGQMEVMKSCGPVYRSHKSSLPFTAIREVDVLISVYLLLTQTSKVSSITSNSRLDQVKTSVIYLCALVRGLLLAIYQVTTFHGRVQ